MKKFLQLMAAANSMPLHIGSPFYNGDGEQIQTNLPNSTVLKICQMINHGNFDAGLSNGIPVGWSNGSFNPSYKPTCSIVDSELNIIAPAAYYDIRRGSFTFPYKNKYYVSLSCHDIAGKWTYGIGTNKGASSLNVSEGIACSILCPNYAFEGQTVSGYLRMYSTSEGSLFCKYFQMIDLTIMFADSGIAEPTSADEFNAMFPNIGYIPYSASAQDVIVWNGKLYYYVE